ncbi:flagellar basal body P-ring biosynthesis protein FlgA [Lacunisphaera limnophila]|uniref:Flagella basal body P-ring formation protein FlgA n=1 Tax=Lacunisphaera limnophila TaxID=1838286 RepID=A0A1D8AW64_9BACT|nr:flagellar basal body P-ring formation chaperone FlgA [Lacunisphaera limnophila]AOS45134.1 flagellar basal body P-ring biosynthesis protein FlgA [Lacunisphaera limnophila]
MRRLLFLLTLLLAASARADAPVSPGPLTQDAFVGAITRELVSHFNLEGDLQLELLRPWASPASLARDWQVVITEYPSVATAAMLLRCRVLADGEPSSDLTITLRAALWRDAWSARQPLAHQATFDPSLLEVRRVDLFRDRDALPAAVGDASYLFVRAVQAGRIVTWRDIARRPLVKKGDMVEVSAAEGSLVISMKALALQSGAQGEAVTLRNLESRKDFTAFVIDENRVQVRF